MTVAATYARKSTEDERLRDAVTSWPGDLRFEEQTDGNFFIFVGQWTIGPFGADFQPLQKTVDMTNTRTTTPCKTVDQAVGVVLGKGGS